MERILIEEQTFEREDFTNKGLPYGVYENCHFLHCTLANVNLSGIQFDDCQFQSCDLSGVRLGQTALKNVKFKDCKLLGLHFFDCNDFLFEVRFENCLLNLSSFYKLKLKKTRFINTAMHEVDFTEADLREAVFDECDLAKALFNRSNLEKADFRTAYNYSIHPTLNAIKKAKFAREGLAGLLDDFDLVID